VVESASNRQYRFGMPGTELSPNEWKKCLDFLSDPNHHIDYLVASGSTPPGVPMDFYASISKIAKDKGAKLVLDTSGEALKAALSAGNIYLAKPNLRELTELVGKELKNIAEQEDAALKVIDKYKIEILVVSLGASGAFLASKAGVYHVAAPSVAKKSTVGAGDSMVAGMVLSLSRGMSLPDTLKFGVAAGTAATMNAGTELCRLEDVEALYKWINANSQHQSRIQL
ncbi:MAG TPA: PfkB family carbohydrate kinase, partial [Cytophagaceae bacterium]